METEGKYHLINNWIKQFGGHLEVDEQVNKSGK